MKKCHIITFGCQMNKADSERIAQELKNKGYKSTPNIKEANLVVVNMCSVRQSAVDRVLGLNQKFSQLKNKNCKLKTVLTGCILKKDKAKFRGMFDEIGGVETWSPEETGSLSPLSQFVRISNGCNNFCTYCVVPHTRGPLVCRSYKDILNEVKKTVKAGIEEIWLLGQNVNDYQSPSSHLINFAKLLKILNEIAGDFEIRFSSPNPADFSNELIDTMAKCQKVAKYLNLPVQSGDDKILKRMNRRYTVKEYKNLVKKIREEIPNINLSTDVIVGFPGETKKQFENTLKLFKEIRFNIAYISKYSPRPGTAAFLLKDNVPFKEKKRREKILMEVLAKQKGS